MSVKNIILGAMSIRQLQPFWMGMHKIALAGMGFMNCDMNRNGEYHFMKDLVCEWNKNDIHSPCIFDIGANYGEFTEKMITLCSHAKIYAFEAIPSTAKNLSQRFLNNKSVIICDKAISDQIQNNITIYDYDSTMGSTHASIYNQSFNIMRKNATSKIEVPCETIDNYAKNNKIEIIDLMKIDIEGSELAALQGAHESLSRNIIKIIQIECNFHFVLSGLSLHRLSTILYNYDIYRLLSNGLEPIITQKNPYNSRQEIYKYSNLIAINKNYKCKWNNY